MVYRFEQMNVSERRTDAKKVEKRFFPQTFRKLISCTVSKNNKQGTLKKRETYFLYRKSQGPKIAKTWFENCFDEFFHSRKVLKQRKVAVYACKTLWFLLKNEERDFMFAKTV